MPSVITRQTDGVQQNGETCVAEISALAARGMTVDRDRITFREERVRHLRDRVLEYAPTFVVMYGGGKSLQRSWNTIASGNDSPSPFKLETIAGWNVGFYSSDSTAFVRAAHPTSVGGPAPPMSIGLA